MIDLATLSETILLENPLDLLFLAPHQVPIIAVGLLPLALVESLEDAVAEGSLELHVLSV